MRRVLFFSLMLVASLAGRFAKATAPAPVYLSYEASSECPNREFFWQQLWWRSTQLASMQPRTQPVFIHARVLRYDGQFSGHVRLTDAEGDILDRDVGGSTCTDVSLALALMAAVSLDGMLLPTQHHVRGPQRHQERRQWSLGLVGGLHKAIDINVSPTLGLGLTMRPRGHSDSPEWHLEALVAQGDQLAIRDAVHPDGAVRFQWLAGRAAACPYQVRFARVAFGPCAVLELGVLSGVASNVSGAKRNSGLWLAPGGLLNWSAQLAPVSLRLAGGGVFPVVRDRFILNPDHEVFRAPGFGLIAEVEAAWVFD